MHPTAAYCALRGLVPRQPIGGGVSNFRITVNDEVRKQLAFLAPSGARTRWVLLRGTMYQSLWYQEITWASIPDDIMDELAIELVDKLIGD